MAEPVIDYRAVLADLEARREAFNGAIDTAIGSIRTILALSSGSNLTGLGNGTVESQDNAFFGLGLVDAAKKHLRQLRRKQSNREIAEALEKGGFVHTSKEFVNTVGTALWRAVKDGDTEIFRQGRYWLLSEWAPGRRRGMNLNSVDLAADQPAADDNE